MISIGPVNFIIEAREIAQKISHDNETVKQSVIDQVSAAVRDLDTQHVESSFLAGPIKYNTSAKRSNTCCTLVLVGHKYDEVQGDKTPCKGLIDVHKLRIVVMGPNDVVKVYPFNTDTKRVSPSNYGGIISAAKTFLTNKLLAIPIGNDKFFYPKSPSNLTHKLDRLDKIKDYIITLKYDGIRMVVVFDENGHPKAYTRHCMPLHVPPVFVQGIDLSQVSLPCVFEAEAYCTLNETQMAHSKMKEKKYNGMKFAVFNAYFPNLPKAPYCQRFELAKRAIHLNQSVVHMVTTFNVKIEAAMEIQSKIEARYSEGIVLWCRDEEYEEQGGLYKIKWAETEEVRVVRYELNASQTSYVVTCRAMDGSGELFDVKLATDDKTFAKLRSLIGNSKDFVGPFDILSTVIVTHYGILQKARKWPTAALKTTLS